MVQLKDLLAQPAPLDEVAERLEQALRVRLGYAG
jgi:lipoyl(octanoyl) transferase